ncbi:MAG TPA: cadmium-translocating P-type ATPase [Firmicutes bacterium]|nr:cadmium-translocating P-type ATPase [Bacillota bacterium]
MKKYKYNINNLDCANCAREVLESLNENKDFKNVIVNFNTKKLIYESDKEFTLPELNRLVKKVEPDAFITDEEVNIKKEYHFSILVVGVIIGLIGYFVKMPTYLKWILYVISYSMLLYRCIINSLKLLIKSKTINENLLITVSCLGALALKNVLEGIMVITLYTIGKILEEKAINNSRNSIKDLMDLTDKTVNIKVGKEVKNILVEDVKVGDILLVKKGEKIGVDGIIKSGTSSIDSSMLTGESEPVFIKEGDKVLSGSINLGDIILVRATSTFEDSTVSKILEMLESATDKKTKTETIVSKGSKIYTPVVLVLSILVMIVLPFFGVNLSSSIYRGLTFLVISCPCAIAISVPLSYFTGIGVCSKNGILVKGSNYLDSLSSAKNIIFDKTGTLTNGTFKVTGIDIKDEEKTDEYNKDDIMEILLMGESLSDHPIAKSIMSTSGKFVDNSRVENYKEISGKGITFVLDGKQVSIGNNKIDECTETASIHMHINGKHVASIFINDGIKENTSSVIKSLQKNDIKTYMFTGDKKDVALEIGGMLGIDEIKYEMLPTDKFKAYESVEKSGLTIFVGDGINDAPVLKRSSVGISMGSVGSDQAIEASDIVILNDDLEKIPLGISISKYTKHIIKENLIFAIGVKAVILVLSVLGLASMWLAVFADTGVTLLTILNTLRIIKKFK